MLTMPTQRMVAKEIDRGADAKKKYHLRYRAAPQSLLPSHCVLRCLSQGAIICYSSIIFYISMILTLRNPYDMLGAGCGMPNARRCPVDVIDHRSRSRCWNCWNAVQTECLFRAVDCRLNSCLPSLRSKSLSPAPPPKKQETCPTMMHNAQMHSAQCTVQQQGTQICFSFSLSNSLQLILALRKPQLPFFR